MKPLYVVLAAIGTLLLFVFLGYYNLYNKAVGLQEGLDEKFANVQSAYQRRADLIPNLVETAKGASRIEQSTLEGVMQARASATQIKLSTDDLNSPEKVQAFQQAQVVGWNSPNG